MNKKRILIIGLIVVLAIATFLAVRLFSGNEDTWICQNSQWVKHGNPSAPMPTSGCGNQNPPSEQADIVVVSPQPNQTITSPLSLQGKAKGTWFFEAVAPVKLVDNNGQELASGHIQAQGDWMTTDYVNFTGQLSFSYNATSSGTLIFNNDNPSGLPQNSKEFRVPVQLIPIDSMKVSAYFSNNNLDPQISCNKVFAVQRQVPKTQATARAALEELLAGPTDQEKNNGYYTSINPGVKIQSLTIQNGTAKADFDETLESGVGGSCRVTAIRAQITETLKQFSTVKSVIISINGRTADILQP